MDLDSNVLLSKRLIKDQLGVDINEIYEKGRVEHCMSLFLPLLYIVQILRFISYLLLDPETSEIYGSSFNYYPQPNIYWILAFILGTLSIFLIKAIHIYTVRFRQSDIVNFANSLRPIFDTKYAKEIGVFHRDSRRLKNLLRYGLFVVKCAVKGITYFVSIVECYAIYSVSKTNNWSTILKHVICSLSTIHMAQQVWQVGSTYLLFFHLNMYSLRYRAEFIKSSLSNIKKVSKQGEIVNPLEILTKLHTQNNLFKDIRLFSSLASKCILAIMLTWLPIDCITLVSATDNRLHPLLRYPLFGANIITNVAVLFMVYNPAQLNTTLRNFYQVHYSIFIQQYQPSRAFHGISIAVKQMCVIKSYLRKNRMGLTVGNSFTISKFVFFKVRNQNDCLHN